MKTLMILMAAFALLLAFGCAQMAPPEVPGPAQQPPVANNSTITPPAANNSTVIPPVVNANNSTVTPPAANSSNNSTATPPNVPGGLVTRAQLAMHNTASDCWVGYKEQVWDLTDWLPRHPGTSAAISPYCGTVEEFTAAFNGQHGTSKDRRMTMEGELKGDLAD